MNPLTGMAISDHDMMQLLIEANAKGRTPDECWLVLRTTVMAKRWRSAEKTATLAHYAEQIRNVFGDDWQPARLFPAHA